MSYIPVPSRLPNDLSFPLSFAFWNGDLELVNNLMAQDKSALQRSFSALNSRQC